MPRVLAPRQFTYIMKTRRYTFYPGLRCTIFLLIIIFVAPGVPASGMFFPQQQKAGTGILDSLFRSGAAYMRQSVPDSAARQYTKGLSLARELGDSAYIGRFYNGLGSVWQIRKAYDKALEHYHEGLKYLDEHRNTSDVAKAYVNLGALYGALKDFDNGREYLENALKILDDESVLRLHVMGNLAAMYLDNDEPVASEEMALSAIPLAEKLGQDYVLSVLYTNLSKIYSDREDWAQAISAGELALDIKDSLQVGNTVAAYNNLGRAYEMSGRYTPAGTYYKKALQQATGEDRALVLQNLKSVAKRQKNYAAALEYAEARDVLRDSLQALDYKGKVAELTEKYESEQKQAKIEYLQAEGQLQDKLIGRQRILTIVSLTLLVLFGVLVYVWNTQNRTRQALEKSKLRQRFLLAQLNPHFIFNALQTVQNFIYMKDAETSASYLGSFGKLIRFVLESSDRDTIALEEEMEMLRNFLYLQQLHYDNSFTYAVSSDYETEAETIRIPVMLVQPFVENAVIHGIQDVPGGHIKVTFRAADEKTMCVEIEDNGSGFFPQEKGKANAMHRSMGMDIQKGRIREFNSEHKRDITVEISPAHPEQEYPGTRVVIRVPVL
ncbi:Tetratricopeptide repeat-containing protein [Sinomicrobium oceani]|uniref:Tetratricopeptide repeat-containing protein n=2 Tax=Sinomicrobium oceani TaxID=1150368 RepID=A0A1K1P6F1_9FLAO|nr:Tetratricopeptide repeat-containing protein [Sinomicrobium oceani]